MNKNDLKDGMKIITRDKRRYYYINGMIFYRDNKNVYDYYTVNNNYTDDLTSTSSKSLDIMKIYYMDELIWERGIDWTKVPFGTKVMAWWDFTAKSKKVEGRFLSYDNDDNELPYFVFIEDDESGDANWYSHCEIIEEEVEQ